MSNDKMRLLIALKSIQKQLCSSETDGRENRERIAGVLGRAVEEWQAALEHKPDVSQPVAVYRDQPSKLNYGVEWLINTQLKDGTLLYASSPDYEALKAENKKLCEVLAASCDDERLQDI